MTSRRITFAALACLVLVLASGALAAAPKTAALVIRHQTRGCHTWSLNGGPYAVHQTVRLRHGGSLTVTNDDLMVQELVKTRGAPVRMELVQQSHMGSMPMHMGGRLGRYAMAHMGATVRVAFPHAGVYRFKLVDRGDYFEGIATSGPDNELTLKVIVS